MTIEPPDLAASPARMGSPRDSGSAAHSVPQALRVCLTEGHSGSHLLINPASVPNNTSLHSSISSAASAAIPARAGDRVTLGAAQYDATGGKGGGLPPQLVCRRRVGGVGGGKWVVMAFGQDACLWSVQVHAQAKPALATGSLKCTSLAQATTHARREIEKSLSEVEHRRGNLTQDLEALDVRISDVNRAFDQMVLQMMLHFQELHQALELRENELLADARKQMQSKVSKLHARREALVQAAEEAHVGVQLASRMLNMQGESEMLQLHPHALKRLQDIKSAINVPAASPDVLAHGTNLPEYRRNSRSTASSRGYLSPSTQTFLFFY